MTTVQSKLFSSAVQSWTIPLWARWNNQALRDRRGEIGDRAFRRGFQQIALEDAERTFVHFDKCLRYNMKPDDLVAENSRLYAGVDPSGKARPGSAIFALANSPQGVRVPVEICYGAWSPDELVTQLLLMNDRWDFEIVMFETNALQIAYVDLARTKQRGRETGRPLRIKGFTTGSNKADEVAGLPGLEIEFERGDWLIGLPQHGTACDRGPIVNGRPQPCGWCAFVEQMHSHPLAGAFDIGMACWMAREAARTKPAKVAGRSLRS